MTRRICFFGNSHLAALREAWVTDPGRWPGIEAQFIGAHKDLLLQTRLEGSVLHPDSRAASDAFARLGGVGSVDLAGFDHIVVTGCMVSLPQAANTYRDARWPGLPSLSSEPDLAKMAPVLMSRAAAQATVEAAIARRLGPRFVRHVRPATDVPIWLTSQPRVSAVVRKRAHPAARSQRIALRNGDGAALSALFEAAAARAVEQAGATFLPQPAQTIAHDILTDLPYVEGAKRLTARGDQPQPPTDIMHANAAYGALVLDQIIAATAA